MNPGPQEAGGLTPLSSERIAAHIAGRRFPHEVEGSDVYGTWRGNDFGIGPRGEDGTVLQVSGRWHAAAPEDQWHPLLELVDEWNAEHVFPTVFVLETDGVLRVHTEVSTKLSHGVTDAQLAQLIDCGIATGLNAFAWLDEQVEP